VNGSQAFSLGCFKQSPLHEGQTAGTTEKESGARPSASPRRKEGRNHGLTSHLTGASGYVRLGRRGLLRVLRLRTGGKGYSQGINQ
jgi:hypothetical protein